MLGFDPISAAPISALGILDALVSLSALAVVATQQAAPATGAANYNGQELSVAVNQPVLSVIGGADVSVAAQSAVVSQQAAEVAGSADHSVDAQTVAATQPPVTLALDSILDVAVQLAAVNQQAMEITGEASVSIDTQSATASQPGITFVLDSIIGIDLQALTVSQQAAATTGGSEFSAAAQVVVVIQQTGEIIVTAVGPISPKILQLEDMIARSATFQAAVGADNETEALDSIHYEYALLDESGLDNDLDLTRLVSLLPCAVILTAEQFQYRGVSYSGRHRLRAEGAFGLLLADFDSQNDEVSKNSRAKRKLATLDFANFYGSVIDEVMQLAGTGEDNIERLPIDQVTLDVPPTRSHPFLDPAANAPSPGEFAPWWHVGFGIHWK